MRLKQRVGLDIAVFDLVQGTGTAGRMAEEHEIRSEIRFELLRRKRMNQVLGDLSRYVRQKSQRGFQRCLVFASTQPLPSGQVRVFERVRKESINEST